MKPLQDRFSSQSSLYKKYRPVYPLELIEEIISHSKGRSRCWDCGTGNGQVARVLSQYYKEVTATDISDSQIKNAFKAPNIRYEVCRAEKTSHPDNSFDLIVVAQAIHWFDFDPFYKEVSRVSKNGGILAVWGYGLLRFDDEIDFLVDKFYTDIVGPFWDEERRHIENAYQSIPFPFEEITLSRKYEITTSFKLSDLTGYLNSWSSVQKYMETHGRNPVEQIIEEIRPFWK